MWNILKELCLHDMPICIAITKYDKRNDDFEETRSTVTLAYEFLPYPEKGQVGIALNRSGEPVCEAEVISLRKSAATDGTALLTIAVPKAYSMKARAFKLNGGTD